VPKEIKNHEYRVAITPAGVVELIKNGHQVIIEKNAGIGSAISDSEYEKSGAKILGTADEIWAQADLILKVKEPIAVEYPKMRKGQILFTYLHLAASKECTDALIKSGTTAIAYETVETENRALPLLAPMSEVAGRLAPQVGAHSLLKFQGGRGLLLGGVPGVRKGNVVVIGGGVSGLHAATIALGFEANVTILDLNVERLKELDLIFDGKVQTLVSNAYEIERCVLEADLVIGAVLVPYKIHNSIFYCVANMPGSVPNTSTYALTNVTMPYAKAIANKGWKKAIADDKSLRLGLNVHEGLITYKAVADAFNLEYTPAEKLISA